MRQCVNGTKGHAKAVMIILAITAMVVSVAIYSAFLGGQKKQGDAVRIDGIWLKEARKDIPEFQLTDSLGRPFTQANLKGRWTMLFFGFTNCGMVCPATMSALNGMYRILLEKLPDSKMPQIVMITVDPERDTIERMHQYVTAFNPQFIGARADIEKTIALEKALHISAAKIVSSGGGKNNYTITHSAEILLFNPAGELQAYFAYPHEAKQMAKDYIAVLNAA